MSSSKMVDYVSLDIGPRCSTTELNIDYRFCIICQKNDTKGLKALQESSVPKLCQAMADRQDKVAERLQEDVDECLWLSEKNPKWHAKCRNTYTLSKSCLYAKKRREKYESEANNTKEVCVEAGESSQGSVGTVTEQCNDKENVSPNCVICGKLWCKGKLPGSKITGQETKRVVIQKAKSLKRRGIVKRIKDNILIYHRQCMNKFRAGRAPPPLPKKKNIYDRAFDSLLQEVRKPMFLEKKGFLLRNLKTRYEEILQQMGISGIYRTRLLKLKLQKRLGEKISIMEQTNGSGFICASSVPLGDALYKLRQLEAKQTKNEKRTQTLKKAAKILRQEMKLCKKNQPSSMEVSYESAEKIVPQSVLEFSRALLSEKQEVLPACNDGEKRLLEKSLILSQQMMQQVAAVPTPLSVGTAYHIFNQTRSKELITLSNRLGQSISYDSLQRQLTQQSMSIMEQIEEEGVFVPQNMTEHPELLPVFAMDNLDWKKKTLEGGTFNATTAIVIKTPIVPTNTRPSSSTSVPSASKQRRKSLTDVTQAVFTDCLISSYDRQRPRQKSSPDVMHCEEHHTNDQANEMLLIWKLARHVSESEIFRISNVLVEDAVVPGFSAFCANLLPFHQKSEISYLPLIPESPTKPSVLYEEMQRLVKTSQALGSHYTVIVGDQATYELASAIKEKFSEEFQNVVLMLGGFHQSHNYLRAVCKLIRGSGVEEILVTAGLCSEGTAKKIVGEKGDYYQSLHSVKIVYEAMWKLYWKAFEEWVSVEKAVQWKKALEGVLTVLLTDTIDSSVQLNSVQNCHEEMKVLKQHLEEFHQSLAEQPTAIFWLSFLEMVSILLRFNYHMREGNWEGQLDESTKMLPFLTAAGHFKYGQQSLPLYLTEMKQLRASAPLVYDALKQGAFVGRRQSGSHNGVSPDMLLEQTYNADAKEGSGLDGITLNPGARTKWVLTKPITAAVSSDLKSMLSLHVTNPHHESGQTRITRDSESIQKVMASIQTNPFRAPFEVLVNISTGQHADPSVQHDLTNIKEIGIKALEQTLSAEGHRRTKPVKLKTFYTQSLKTSEKSSKNVNKGKSNELTVLLRMTQIATSGEELDAVSFVGIHECSDAPPALFVDGLMRSTTSKFTLVDYLMKETKIEYITKLPEDHMETAVVIDAMHVIRKWSFTKDESFSDIARRYLKNIFLDVPQSAIAVHFCCDRYSDTTNLKHSAHVKRYGESGKGKIYEVQGNYKAPDPQQFFATSANKANLLRFLCETWCSDSYNQSSSSLYLGGGFQDLCRSVMVKDNTTVPISELESTQVEADTRILLHGIYSFHHGAKRIIILANDTDVIISAIYYAANILSDCELYIKTAPHSYLPVHKIAQALQPTLCKALPFLHSIGGRDTTSFMFQIGKRAWVKKFEELGSPLALANFGEAEPYEISEEFISQARNLVLSVYLKKGESLDELDLAKLRVQKFLNNKSTQLSLLPPTEDAFLLHIKRAALATLVDKSAHMRKPNLGSFENFGWCLENKKLEPVSMILPPWPEDMKRRLSCNCIKGCNTAKCPCSRRGVACQITCRCRGSKITCVRARLFEALASSSDSENSADELA